VEQFSATDLNNAIDELSICEFFPREPGAQAAVMKLLAKMCPHREALRWLVDQFVNHIGKWHGPAELRAVLCMRFRPADSIEGYSALPGYRTGDCEDAALSEHEQRKIGWIHGEVDEPKQITPDPEAARLLKRLTGKEWPN